MSTNNNDKTSSPSPSPEKSPTPSQLHALHTSTYRNPPHLRGMDQRLKTNSTPEGTYNTGGGGMKEFMGRMSWFGGSGGGARDGKGGDEEKGGKGGKGSKL